MMKKRMFARLCVSVMVFSLTACAKEKVLTLSNVGNSATSVAETTTETVTASEAEATTETATASEAESASAEASATEATAPAASEGGFDLTSVDYSNPTLVIEFDDATAMEAFLQDMINLRIEEGTVVKVTGKASTTLSTSLMAKKSDGGSIGVMMTVQGEWEQPVNGTILEAVGVMVKGQYSMEYHVLPENIVVVDK